MEAFRACTAVVRGHVQGVYFRDFARVKARSLGLAGYCRNLPDGSSVEVYAEGNPASLERLLAHLHVGPARARVDTVEVSWKKPSGTLADFQVR